MFQKGFPSIIRSSKLHTQRQVFVKPILLPAASLAGSSIKGKIESHLAKTLSRWPVQTKIVLTKLLRERRPGVLPLTPKQSDRILNGLVRHPPGRRNWNSKVPHQDNIDNFFYTQGVVNKEFVPQEKTVNTEFYKGVMDRLLKHIQRVSPAAFCSRDFCCCKIMRPPTMLQVFANFWPKKCYIPLSPPVLSRFISARLFSVPQVENAVKRTARCGCCWDPRSRNWLIKEGPKTGIFGTFQKLYDRPKACIYANWAYFE